MVFKRKKMTAWFLVLVMICSLFVGMPVSATEGDVEEEVASITGLVVKDWIDWDENGPYVNEEAEFSKEAWATPKEDKLLYLAYLAEVGGEETAVTAEEITITCEDENVNVKDMVCTQSEENESLVMIQFPDCGEYVITYTGEGDQNKSITVYVDYPEVGFYTSTTQSVESYIANNRFVFSDVENEEEKTFYMILQSGDNTITLAEDTPILVRDHEDWEIAIEDEEVIAEYITYEEVENTSGVYKMVVQTDRNFYLEAKASVTDLEENSWECVASMDVEYVRTMDGLVVKDWIDWDENGPYVNEEAEFSKEAWATPKEDRLLYFAYLAEEDGEETAVTAEEIIVTCEDENVNVEDMVCTQSEENDSLVMIQFPDCGEYVVTYTGEGDKNKSVKVYVEYPEIGFYTSATQSTDGIIGDGCFTFSDMDNEEAKTFYLILKSDNNTVALAEENPLKVTVYEEGDPEIIDQEEINSNYLKCEAVENAEGVYKMTVLTDKAFGLDVNALITDPEENQWEDSRHIDIQYVSTGLMFADTIWGEEGLTGEVWEDSYSKSMEAEIYSVRWLWLGTTEDGENYTAIDASAFDEDAENPVLINGSTDYIVKAQEEWPFDAERDTVIIDENLAANGIYGFYVRDDLEISYNNDSVTIAKNLPAIGFYKANEASFDNYIRDEYLMNQSEMFDGMDIYVLPREGVTNYSYTLETIDNTILVNDEKFAYEHVPEEYPTGYYKATYTSPIKVSVSECSGSFLRVKGNIVWNEETDETEYCEQYLGLTYDRGEKDAPIILEDGKPHEGFAGCLMSKSDYNVSQWWMMSGDIYYWVHADTIQGVVDELAKVAEAGEVTVDGKTYPISMTDYIWLNTSYFQYSEKFAESTQHVVTPSNIKGIIMQAGAEAPYALYDDGDIKGYFQVQEWKKDEEILLLTQTRESSDYYEVRSEEEAITQQADYVVSDYENVWTAETLDEAGYTAVTDAYGDPLNTYPVYLPNLYVDATVEVKLIGNFGDNSVNKKVQLGFYEGSTNKSIINGVEFSAEDIGTEPVVVGDEDNQVTVTVTEFKASTECTKAPIGGVDCEVTLAGENASLRDKIDIYHKGDDNYADAKELAEGKPLKVKLDVGAAEETTDESKKIAQQMEKDCQAHKKEASKVQYLDINMEYQVGDREPIEVTETLEEVDITMSIPDGFREGDKHAKHREYKVYRYHDGKVDVLPCEFDNDKNELHFKTDGFSTYALVAEEVVATGIEVTTNPTKLSYVEGEKFDTTGMTVSLVYSDGSKETVTGYSVSATNALALTDKTVTITYDGFTVQIPVNVIAKPANAEKPEDVLPTVGETATTANGSCKVTAIALDGTVEVTFTPSKSNKKAKKAKIDKTVTIDGKEYAVTAIADGAFSGNTKMTGISIPNTVTKIGKNAFKGCTKLKKITIPKSVTVIGKNAFYNCKKISKVTIKGNGLDKIEAGAFRKCSSLKSVTIPKNVTEIGKDAFRDCKNLSKVTIKGTKIKKIGKNAFKNIAKKSTIKVPKSKKKDYKSLLKKAGYTKTVK